MPRSLARPPLTRTRAAVLMPPEALGLRIASCTRTLSPSAGTGVVRDTTTQCGVAEGAGFAASSAGGGDGGGGGAGGGGGGSSSGGVRHSTCTGSCGASTTTLTELKYFPSGAASPMETSPGDPTPPSAAAAAWTCGAAQTLTVQEHASPLWAGAPASGGTARVQCEEM